jgi:hypothetical protein
MSTHTPIAEPPVACHEVLAALLAGDLPTAEKLAAELVSSELIETAHACMRGRRWGDAAWLFDRLDNPDGNSQLKRCLSRNLAALQLHRPAVYQAMVTLPTETRCAIGAAADGRPTIIVRRPNGQNVCLSPSNNPMANVAAAMRGLQPALNQGLPLGLCGVGDGYLLAVLAQRPTKLFMDMQTPAFIIEPDGQLLLHCLMIHDLSGPTGPIEQRRFNWFIGPDWHDDLQHTLLNDPYLPCPAITVCQGIDSAPLAAGLRETAEVLAERDKRLKAQVEAYYAELIPEELSAVTGPNPPRPPRVLLMTTRFSTVLQYATADAAEAFEKLGWEVRVLIEPTPAHRLLHSATRSELVEFQPDMVFQLDHLRYEHPGLFPANLPFVCWIQDHLPNLRTAEAASSITERDFVLTDAPAMYGSTFSYPQRQCIPLTKLTRVPAQHLFEEEAERGDDLVFVSNAAHQPQRIVAERVAAYDGSSQGRTLLEKSAQRVIGIYELGGCVATYFEMLGLLRTVQKEIAAPIGVAEFDAVAGWIFHPLNDSLYRQQALRWVRDAAVRMGMTFALYGNGWDKHPDFAAYARGPVSYGPKLQRLTRASRFNLQIVPYHCLHQRLLDGLAAGGFYLTRRHISDTAARDLLEFLCAHAPSAQTLAAARAALVGPLRERLNELADAFRPAIATSEQDDPVEAVRGWHAMGLVEPGRQVLPHFDLTSFTSSEELTRAISRFAADPKLRQTVQEEQRNSVIERFTYEAGLGRFASKLHDLLKTPSMMRSRIEQARIGVSESRKRKAV